MTFRDVAAEKLAQFHWLTMTAKSFQVIFSKIKKQILQSHGISSYFDQKLGIQILFCFEFVFEY